MNWQKLNPFRGLLRKWKLRELQELVRARDRILLIDGEADCEMLRLFPWVKRVAPEPSRMFSILSVHVELWDGTNWRFGFAGTNRETVRAAAFTLYKYLSKEIRDSWRVV